MHYNNNRCLPCCHRRSCRCYCCCPYSAQIVNINKWIGFISERKKNVHKQTIIYLIINHYSLFMWSKKERRKSEKSAFKYLRIKTVIQRFASMKKYEAIIGVITSLYEFCIIPELNQLHSKERVLELINCCWTPKRDWYCGYRYIISFYCLFSSAHLWQRAIVVSLQRHKFMARQ